MSLVRIWGRLSKICVRQCLKMRFGLLGSLLGTLWVTLMVLSNASAQADATAAPAAQPSPLMSFVPFVFMIGVLYLLVFRPQSKRQKTHVEFLTKLKRGDQVVTNSGILGTIEGITEQFVTLEVASGVKIKMLKNQIATAFSSEVKV